MAPPAAPPRDSATVILLRHNGEILMIRRHQKSGFFGGAHAFPGGKLDPEDSSPDVLARLGPDAVAACAARLEPTPGTELTPEIAAGLYVAACRELFEEAGVLLAKHPNGEAWKPPDPDPLRALMLEVHSGALPFVDLLTREELLLDLAGLAYWSHWVTPSLEPKRYDTRFFVARLPAGQQATIDAHEATDYLWQTPSGALAAYGAGEIMLPPPTFRTLEELDQALGAGASGDSFPRLRGRTVRAIQPKATNIDGRFGVLLPWDPLYSAADGQGLEVPDFPAAWRAGVSRVLFNQAGKLESSKG